MKNLGILWILYGILRVAGAAAIVIWESTLTRMFGALITNTANPFALMNMFHIALIFVVVIGVIAGIVALLAGFALMTGGDAAKPLSLLRVFFWPHKRTAGHRARRVYALLSLLARSRQLRFSP